MAIVSIVIRFLNISPRSYAAAEAELNGQFGRLLQLVTRRELAVVVWSQVARS